MASKFSLLWHPPLWLWHKVNESQDWIKSNYSSYALNDCTITDCGMRGRIFAFGKLLLVESTTKLIVVRAFARLLRKKMGNNCSKIDWHKLKRYCNWLIAQLDSNVKLNHQLLAKLSFKWLSSEKEKKPKLHFKMLMKFQPREQNAFAFRIRFPFRCNMIVNLIPFESTNILRVVHKCGERLRRKLLGWWFFTMQ